MSAAVNLPVIDVAVCVVQSPDGRVLLAERTARQIAAGFWELPGGKIEFGESAPAAAARELHEETGLTPVGLTPWIEYEHRFPTKRVRLHFFRAQGWQGTPHGREGQRVAWAHPAAPQVGPVLPSNDRALFALALPAAYKLAELGVRDSHDDFLARLRAELAGGTKLIRLRVPTLPPGQTASLLARVGALANEYPQATLLASSVMDASRAGLGGVHSCSRALQRLTSRPPVRVWAATCHNDADLSRAVSLGADFVVLGPIRADPERPQDRPVGWDGLRRLAASCPVSVYAQGGLTADHLPAARQAGAAGVVIRIDKPPDAARRVTH